MTHPTHAPLGRVAVRRWLALPLSAIFGGLLVALVFAGLRARPAAAAGPAEPATLYACTEAGLDSALAAGGSATFSCGSPTTVTVSGLKNVLHTVTLDGGNNLILSGGTVTGVFSVTSGIHLSLLNMTIRDTSALYGGAIYNNGVADITHVHFISNTAFGGADLFNAPGAVATVANSTIQGSQSLVAGLLNGTSLTQTASLSVVNSLFLNNLSLVGSAIFNFGGPVTVTGSTFNFNQAGAGGAILNNARLRVNNSQFFGNSAGSLVAASAVAASRLQTTGPRAPSGIVSVKGGGAIDLGPLADTIIASSQFTGNYSTQGGGAILFGDLPLSGTVTPTVGSLVITGSSINDNCTAGPGGGLATSQKTSVSDSTFSDNFAISGALGCVAWAANHPASALPVAPNLASTPALTVPAFLSGSGGAIFNASDLHVTNTAFLFNSASVTPTGGGGAIANFFLSSLNVQHGLFQENFALNDGGAIFNDAVAFASLTGSTFNSNTVQYDSGGAVASLGTLHVQYSRFTANSGAPGQGIFGDGGGAIFQGIPLAVNGPAGPNAAVGNGRRQPAAPQGIFFTGLTVDHSTFVSNSSEFEGGAIDGANTSIFASTFQSNTAAYGGAFDVLNNLFNVDSSTFIANGAIATSRDPASQGGVIDTNQYTVTVTNSTFFANYANDSATGGAINNDPGGTVYITNSTFLSNTANMAGNGGTLSQGIFGQIVLRDVLLAFSGGGDCNAAVTLSGANLEFGDASCGAASVTTDPKILPPANNGGPTLTSALLASSPAINTGDDAGCPTTDQRGAHRPVGPHCDIGAFEFGGQVPWLWLPLVQK